MDGCIVGCTETVCVLNCALVKRFVVFVVVAMNERVQDKCQILENAQQAKEPIEPDKNENTDEWKGSGQDKRLLADAVENVDFAVAAGSGAQPDTQTKRNSAHNWSVERIRM